MAGARKDNPPFARMASKITERKVDWIIEYRLALGKLHETIGEPAEGKTTLAIDLAARITNGNGLLDWPILQTGPVAFLSAEDDAEDTLVPRFRVAQADLNLVRILSASFLNDGKVQPLTLPLHIGMLEQVIVKDGLLALFIDPIAAFLGEKTDTHNDSSSRRVLAELHALAERTNCAIVLIRHLNKMGSVDRAMHRGGGSIAFTAAPRLSFLVGFDPTDRAPEWLRRRVVACVKNNLGPKPPSLAFYIVGEANEPSQIDWITGTCAFTADDLLRVHHERKADAFNEAVAFLESELSDGPKLVSEVEQRASLNKISDSTLSRARRALGIKSIRDGFGGPCRWQRHDDESEAQDA